MSANIFEAIQAGDLAAVRQLLERDSRAALDTNAGGVSALMMALYIGRRDIADAIRPSLGTLNVFEAASYGDVDSLRATIEAERELLRAYSSDGFTALHFAAFFTQEEAVRALLELGGAVDAVTRNDMANQPLHAAAAGGSVAICALLLDHGADVNATQHGSFTPLHEAAHRNDLAMVDLFLARGAEVSVQNDEGKAPRDIALEHGHDETAARLS